MQLLYLLKYFVNIYFLRKQVYSPEGALNTSSVDPNDSLTNDETKSNNFGLHYSSQQTEFEQPGKT